MKIVNFEKTRVALPELRDFPLFFHYFNLMPETAEHDLLTDIYLPLK